MERNLKAILIRKPELVIGVGNLIKIFFLERFISPYCTESSEVTINPIKARMGFNVAVSIPIFSTQLLKLFFQ